jgi:hypothetical protein
MFELRLLQTEFRGPSLLPSSVCVEPLALLLANLNSINVCAPLDKLHACRVQCLIWSRWDDELLNDWSRRLSCMSVKESAEELMSFKFVTLSDVQHNPKTRVGSSRNVVLGRRKLWTAASEIRVLWTKDCHGLIGKKAINQLVFLIKESYVLCEVRIVFLYVR